jgi:hypothetical protein
LSKWIRSNWDTRPNVRAEHRSSSRWPCPRSPAVEAASVEISMTRFHDSPTKSRDPDHEDKSVAWIPDCCWPVHGTTDPATSATEDGDSPVLEQTMLMHGLTEIPESVADVYRRGDRHQQEDSVRQCSSMSKEPLSSESVDQSPARRAVVGRRSRPPRMTNPRASMRRS